MKQSADQITKVMQNELLLGIQVPKGRSYQSHSARKSMCSLALAAGGQKVKVMNHGGWKTEKAMLPYDDSANTTVTEFSRTLFDFLM